MFPFILIIHIIDTLTRTVLEPELNYRVFTNQKEDRWSIFLIDNFVEVCLKQEMLLVKPECFRQVAEKHEQQSAVTPSWGYSWEGEKLASTRSTFSQLFIVLISFSSKWFYVGCFINFHVILTMFCNKKCVLLLKKIFRSFILVLGQ